MIRSNCLHFSTPEGGASILGTGTARAGDEDEDDVDSIECSWNHSVFSAVRVVAAVAATAWRRTACAAARVNRRGEEMTNEAADDELAADEDGGGVEEERQIGVVEHAPAGGDDETDDVDAAVREDVVEVVEDVDKARVRFDSVRVSVEDEAMEEERGPPSPSITFSSLGSMIRVSVRRGRSGETVGEPRAMETAESERMGGEEGGVGDGDR